MVQISAASAGGNKPIHQFTSFLLRVASSWELVGNTKVISSYTPKILPEARVPGGSKRPSPALASTTVLVLVLLTETLVWSGAKSGVRGLLVLILKL